MPKYVFYNLSYAITMFNTIKKMIKNVLKTISFQSYDSCN
jgi:hypothetical protein